MYSLFFHIISYDIWFYISHLWLHHKNYYNLIHKQHHTKLYTLLHYLDTYDANIIENLIQPIGIVIPILFIETNFLYLCISFIFISIRGVMRHDNRCSRLFGNHHLLHHKYPNYNFGEYWIDTLCKTKYPNDKEYIYGKLYT